MNGRHLLVLLLLASVATAQNSEDVCSEPQDREFDFWIGEWDIENRQGNPGNPTDPTLYATGPAAARIFPVADGCGIVELWEGELSWGKVLGFSLRSYDSTTNRWTLLLNWPAPNAGVPAAFTLRDGEFRHGRGEFFSSTVGADGKTVHSRFTFSDIHAERYRWDGAVSTDAGRNWQTTWIMEGSRRAGSGSGALRPDRSEGEEGAACGADPGSRDLAFLNGEWSGMSSDNAPVEFKVVPVMGGCAVIEFLSVGGDPKFEEFRVRAYQADQQRWQQYSVNNRSEGLELLVGKTSAKAINWEADTAENAREQTTLDDNDALHLWRKLPGDVELDAVLSQTQ